MMLNTFHTALLAALALAPPALALAPPVPAEQSNTKQKARLLPAGKIFHLPKVAPSCASDEACQELAAKHCLKAKAKKKFCAEQYSGAWTTTCICE